MFRDLADSIRRFGITPGYPEADNMARAIQDHMDERIKAREEALRAGPPPMPLDVLSALKPREPGVSPTAHAVRQADGLSHPFGDPWVTAPAKRYVPYVPPTEGWDIGSDYPKPISVAEPPTVAPLCNHDLFACTNTLVLQSRTVTCEHCERSFKL
jgi:hypothetical protein